MILIWWSYGRGIFANRNMDILATTADSVLHRNNEKKAKELDLSGNCRLSQTDHLPDP